MNAEDVIERQTYTVQEAGRIVGICKNSAYEAVRSGALPGIKIGGKWVVPKAALDRLLSNVGGASA